MNQRIVVMGGSFNPPTIAHLRLMQAAVAGIQASQGIFVPASHTYVRNKMRKARQLDQLYSEQFRLELLEAMCAGDGRLTVDTLQFQENRRDYEMLELLQEKHPEAKLYFLMGADKLEVLPRWHRSRELMENFKLLVFRREGTEPEAYVESNDMLSAYQSSFIFLPEPDCVAGVSSTMVRGCLKNGESAEKFLHPDVWALLQAHEPEVLEISCFRGRYGFLSNFHQAPVEWDDLTYMNAEAAFQAAKLLSNEERQPFTTMSPNDAKRYGRRVPLREDWEQVKTQIMEEVVRAKFVQNIELRELLLATGSAELIEGNTWGDTCWGVDVRNGKGENRLGQILMKIRAELKNADIGAKGDSNATD